MSKVSGSKQLASLPDGGKSPAYSTPGKSPSIGQYLIRRLLDHKVGHVFGIPGDYVLNFYAQMEKSPLKVVGCTREDCAGFAADAYARITGLGVVCVTYCVGGLSVCNSIAGAYAEKSPVLVISGSPGLSERINNPLLHHKVRDFRTQLEVFEKLTIACAELGDPVIAYREIDRVLDTITRFKRPGYLELPRDIVDVIPHIAHAFHSADSHSDPSVAEEAAEEVAALLTKSKRPLIVAGVEIHRFGLQDLVLKLAESSQIPMVATLLGKSVIRETHPLYAGLYEGAMGKPELTRWVEESDCVLLLGAFMTDINLGVFTANLDPSKCVYATSEQLRVRNHHYHGVALDAFLKALLATKPGPPKREMPSETRVVPSSYTLEPERRVSIARMIARLNQQIDNSTIVIADIGDSLFASTDLVTQEHTEFISPAYYTSMGFSVPAALGALHARPASRVLVICGDGAFQMTGMELSNIVKRGFSPIVIILDNGGYGTERFLHAGDWQFNEIHGWKYHALPAVLGGGKGYEIKTEAEFDAALNQAWNDRSGLSILHVHLDRTDASVALRRLAERFVQVI